MSQRSLHHVSVPVGDIERARRFYEDVLGVGAIERPNLGVPGVWYRAGASEIHLVGSEQSLCDGVNSFDPHFALEVDDLAALRHMLDELGIPHLALGEGVLWVGDPDENTVELRMPGQPLG